jgi:hypothetical protein
VNPNPSLSPPLPDAMLESIADALWGRMVGAHLDPIVLNLRAKLASAQISAQIKIDEATIVQRRRDDTLKIILEKIAIYEAAQKRESQGLPPLIEGECTKD